MWYVAGVCAVVLLSAVAGFAKNKPGSDQKSVMPLDVLASASDAELVPETLTSLSTTQINILLARLEIKEPPQATMGAMCYEAMAAPAVAEYICPVCGEKTIYNYSQSAFINWQLDNCRRLAESINSRTDFEILLDEGLFCDFCSPDAGDEEPALLLCVIRENGEEVVNRVNIYDLMKLDSFLGGNLYYLTETDGEEPLQDSAERIRELLGLEKE